MFGLLVKKNKGKRKETRGERRKTGQKESERELKRKEREKMEKGNNLGLSETITLVERERNYAFE